MPQRRATLLIAAGVVVLLAAAATAGVRLAARKPEPAWQPPPASGPAPPPPLGVAPPAAGSATAPTVLRVDSSGCAPVEEQRFTGAMTLDSLARSSGIPVDMLIRGLELPTDVPRTATLGGLTREPRFTLEDVRRAVEDYLKHCE